MFVFVASPARNSEHVINCYKQNHSLAFRPLILAIILAGVTISFADAASLLPLEDIAIDEDIVEHDEIETEVPPPPVSWAVGAIRSTSVECRLCLSYRDTLFHPPICRRKSPASSRKSLST